MKKTNIFLALVLMLTSAPSTLIGANIDANALLNQAGLNLARETKELRSHIAAFENKYANNPPTYENILPLMKALGDVHQLSLCLIPDQGEASKRDRQDRLCALHGNFSTVLMLSNGHTKLNEVIKAKDVYMREVNALLLSLEGPLQNSIQQTADTQPKPAASEQNSDRQIADAQANKAPMPGFLSPRVGFCLVLLLCAFKLAR